MKRQNFKLIKTIFFLIISFVIFTASSYAWIAGNSGFLFDVGGKSITGYFAGGDGNSESTAFEIANETHLYNLAWLQNKGAFDGKQYYFKLTEDIEVAGKLNGSDTTTGAVPPIGTTEYPFSGVFDGNSHVIKNLWVSSFKDDWKEQPSNLSQDYSVGNYVGFFGKVAQDTDKTPVQIPVIKNLVLENLEVTTHIQSTETVKSTVGLIAGYSNANMEKIGVKNGIITTKDNNSTINIKSQTVLIGELGGNVEWEDGPTGTGNKLLIDPNDPNNIFSTVNTGKVLEIPNSSTGNAYYIGQLTRATVNGGLSNYFLRNNNITGWYGQTGIVRYVTENNENDSTSLDKANLSTELKPNVLWDRIRSISTTPNYIIPTTIDFSILTKASPTQSEIESLPTLPNGNSVPKNAIWFKPTHAGTCSIAVTKTNNNAPVALSLFAYERVSATKIKEPIEIKFFGAKEFGNKALLIFNIEIPEEAVGKYEFVVGKSTFESGLDGKKESGVAGFVYLVLPGTGNQDSEESVATLMKRVDYANKISDSYDVLQATYTQKNVLLYFDEGPYSGSMYFNTNDNNLSPKVYYKDNATEQTAFVKNKITGGAGEYNQSAYFPSRDETG